MADMLDLRSRIWRAVSRNASRVGRGEPWRGKSGSVCERALYAFVARLICARRVRGSRPAWGRPFVVERRSWIMDKYFQLLSFKRWQ